MKKRLFLGLFLLLCLCAFAGAGGNMKAALQAQIRGLAANNEALAAENEALAAENEALRAAQLPAQEERYPTAEHNPIDDYFAACPYGADPTTRIMNAVAAQEAQAWEAELGHLAEEMKSALAFDEDRTLVDGYVADTEKQAERMWDMTLFVCADTETAPEERIYTAGTIRGVPWGSNRAQIYKDAFFQLLGTSRYCWEGGYPFSFDPAAAQAALAEQAG